LQTSRVTAPHWPKEQSAGEPPNLAGWTSNLEVVSELIEANLTFVIERG
jgi:hypothetical protein